MFSTEGGEAEENGGAGEVPPRVQWRWTKTVRGEGPVSSSLGQRQLRDSTADFQKQLDDRNHVAGSVLTRPFWSGVHHLVCLVHNLVSSRKPFCTTWFE